MRVLFEGPRRVASRMLVYDSINTSHAPSTMDREVSEYDLSTSPTLHSGLFWLTTVPMHETMEHCWAA